MSKDKRTQFQDTAKKYGERIIKAYRALSALSRSPRVEFTEEDIKKVFRKLYDEHYDAEQQLNKALSPAVIDFNAPLEDEDQKAGD